MWRVCLLLAILATCSPGAEKRDISNMTEQKRSDLEHQLVAAGYDGLFLYGERSRADALWARGGNQPALEGIIADATTSLQTKFLAAELLRAKGVRLSSAAAPVCAGLRRGVCRGACQHQRDRRQPVAAQRQRVGLRPARG